MEDKTQDVFISVKLTGRQADLFNRYKETHHLRLNSEAARKAMFDAITRELGADDTEGKAA